MPQLQQHNNIWNIKERMEHTSADLMYTPERTKLPSCLENNNKKLLVGPPYKYKLVILPLRPRHEQHHFNTFHLRKGSASSPKPPAVLRSCGWTPIPGLWLPKVCSRTHTANLRLRCANRGSTINTGEDWVFLSVPTNCHSLRCPFGRHN